MDVGPWANRRDWFVSQDSTTTLTELAFGEMQVAKETVAETRIVSPDTGVYDIELYL